MNKKHIWLFGENLGKTANNNSFYFWLESLRFNDEIEKYFVLEKTKENIKHVGQLSEYERKYICWRNSLKHFKLYFSASMYFVSLSYRDVRPEKLYWKKANFLTEKPVIYLQHGILGIKQIGYNGMDYNNNMFRFIYYNKKIYRDLVKINGFREYQLCYGEYLPRYRELVTQYLQDKHNNFKILFFPTWREYFGNNFATKKYIYVLKRIVEDKRLNSFLASNNIDFKICLHQFFSKSLLDNYDIKENNNIEIVCAEDINLLHEIAVNDMCITDYSSIGFDFTILNKPVILFQPDREEYLKKRKIYCSLEELEDNSIVKIDKLIDAIIKGEYHVNKFFRCRLPEKIDLEYIRTGIYLKKTYRYFYDLQMNNIIFLGYNFYGVGGTVSATNALAEGLLERGYLVTLMSLKKHSNTQEAAKGLNMQAFISEKSGKKIDKLKKVYSKIFGLKKYFNKDSSKEYIYSYCEKGLEKLLEENKYKYYFSTRESIHLYLDDAKNIPKNSKFYFYHTDANVVDKYFPKLLDEIAARKLDNAIFVTERNRIALERKFGLNDYNKYLILGNSLSSKRSMNKDELVIHLNSLAETTNAIKRGIFLLRITRERINDLQYMIGFAKFLKKTGIQGISIDVFGDGDYKIDFENEILISDVMDIIDYKGKVNNPKNVMKEYDFVVDFSENQSFGMVYIEAILNGKIVFCRHNNGSDEILGDLPESFYHSYEELALKIENIDKMYSNIMRNYQYIYDRYSRGAVTKKIIEFM